MSTLIAGLNGQLGSIILHYEVLKEISKSHLWRVSADISKLSNSDKSWRNCNCFSQNGFSFAYYNYVNQGELGNYYNLILFAKPYLGFKKRLHTYLRAGMGATELDQVYDEVTNPFKLFYN